MGHPEHPAEVLRRLRSIVEGPGGRLIAVTGEEPPFYCGVRSAPAATLFDAALAVMAETSYQRIVAFTGVGPHLPSDRSTAAGFHVGRIAGGWMVRGVWQPAVHQAAVTSLEADAERDAAQLFQARRRESGNRVVFIRDTVSWLEGITHLLERMELVCGFAWERNRHIPSAQQVGPVPRTLILLDEMLLRPHIPEDLRHPPNPEHCPIVKARWRDFPHLLRSSKVDLVFLAPSRRKAEALAKGRLIVDEIADWIRNDRSDLTEQAIERMSEMNLLPAFHWPDLEITRFTTVNSSTPRSEFLPEGSPSANFYNLLTRTPARLPSSPEERLNREIIGCEPVKRQVRSLINTARVQAESVRRGLSGSQEFNLNTILIGNPGTGKTTVAEILAEAYGRLGLISGSKFTPAKASDLIAGYVGQSRLRTEAVCEKALGGVLFIDEAYDLTPRHGNSFGDEVLASLLTYTAERNQDLAVILAGYPDKMEQLIAANEGLRRRFPHRLIFEDYTDQELLEICRLMVNKRNHLLAPGCDEVVQRRVREHRAFCKSTKRNFGNAGDVKNLVQSAIQAKSARIAATDETKATDEQLMTLLPDDFVHATI